MQWSRHDNVALRITCVAARWLRGREFETASCAKAYGPQRGFACESTRSTAPA